MKKLYATVILSLYMILPSSAADTVESLRKELAEREEEVAILRETISRIQLKNNLDREVKRKKNANRKPAPLDMGKIAADPADYFFSAWLLCRNANKLPDPEKLANLRIAAGVFASIRKAAPEWKPDLVEERLKAIQADIAKLGK